MHKQNGGTGKGQPRKQPTRAKKKGCVGAPADALGQHSCFHGRQAFVHIAMRVDELGDPGTRRTGEPAAGLSGTQTEQESVLQMLIC